MSDSSVEAQEWFGNSGSNSSFSEPIRIASRPRAVRIPEMENNSGETEEVRRPVETLSKEEPVNSRHSPKPEQEEPKRTLVRLEDGSYYLSSQVVGIRIPAQAPKVEEPLAKDSARGIPRTPLQKEESSPLKKGGGGSSAGSTSSGGSQDVSPDPLGSSRSQPPLPDDGRRKGERITRKRTVRYDPSEYVFPALKRKKKDPALEASLKVKKKRGRKPLKKVTPGRLGPVQPVGRPPTKNLAAKTSSAAPPVMGFAGEDSGSSGANSNNNKWEDEEESICLCSICNFSGNKTNDRMIACSRCSNQGHYSCIINSKIGHDKNWLCPDCREAACVECEQTSNKGPMISCDLCGESFHYSCHVPQVRTPPKGPWRCSRCPTVTTIADIRASILGPPSGTISLVDPPKLMKSDLDSKPAVNAGGGMRPDSPAPCLDMKCEDDEVILVSDGESVDRDPLAPDSPLPTPAPSPPPPAKILLDPYDGIPVDLSIPDPSGWTSKQVYGYFKKHFEDAVATAFQDQDIDGQSLLLMRRTDVVKGLGFKLGVALRVLYHIRRLQIRRSNLRLLWA